MVRVLSLLLVVVWFAGCGGGGTSYSPVRPKTARVDWLGHQAFLFRSSLGTTILINPYAPGSVPHSLPKNLNPEVLLISHEKRQANYADALDNFPVVLRSSVGVGTHNASGIRVRGVETFPDPSRPDVAEMNLVFCWTVDGVHYVFLGDLAAPLSQQDAMRVGRADVLFLPVGGRLNATGRTRVLEQLQPKLIIPMGPSSAVSSWAAAFPRVHRPGTSHVLINAAVLPTQPTAILLSTP